MQTLIIVLLIDDVIELSLKRLDKISLTEFLNAPPFFPATTSFEFTGVNR